MSSRQRRMAATDPETGAALDVPPYSSQQLVSSVRPVIARDIPHTNERTLAYTVRADTIKAHETRTTKWRVIMFFAWTVGLIAILVILTMALLQSSAVQESLMTKSGLARNRKDGTGMPVTYESISGWFPCSFTVEGLSIVDPTGRSVSSGRAKVTTSLKTLSKGSIVAADVHLVRSSARGGFGYIEDNRDFNEVEKKSYLNEAKRRTNKELWPNLPYGLHVDHLLWEDFTIPEVLGVNRTLRIEGSIKMRNNGGDFDVAFHVSDSLGEFDIDLVVHGEKARTLISTTITATNSSLLCPLSGSACHTPINVSSLFIGTTGEYQVESRSDVQLQVTGTWTSLLNLAFPSKSFIPTGDLISGTARLSSLHPRALLSRGVVMFRVDANRTLHVEEARVNSPLMMQDTPFVFNCTFKSPPGGANHSRTNDTLTTLTESFVSFGFPLQRVNLPLPLGDVEISFDSARNATTEFIAGNWWLRKFDILMGTVPWTAGSGFTLGLSTSTYAYRDFSVLTLDSLAIEVGLGQMSGWGEISYGQEDGLRVDVRLNDPVHQLSTELTIVPVYDMLNERSYSLFINLLESQLTFRQMTIGDLAIQASVYGLPSEPYGVLHVRFGTVDYGNGMFVMNNASVTAARDGLLANFSAPWEFTASSDRDLRTRFTLYLVGQGDYSFSGSVSPFEALLYKSHLIWTSEPSHLRFNYRDQTYSVQSSFHANNAEPTRQSLQVFVDQEKMRLLLNDDAYLLDPILMHQQLRLRGLIQGYAELQQPLLLMQPGEIDLCWNQGELYRTGGASAASDTLFARAITGCLRGSSSIGWTVDHPAATLSLVSPQVGDCELRANITMLRDPPTSSMLQVPVSMQLRLVDTANSPWLREGWVATQAKLLIKL